CVKAHWYDSGWSNPFDYW
nr:immunoglobulin heavy chain junction region [Macaca mulatta]MOV54366.1 immunoglobulin heavy chain junction region [Macaca mulatta]MOV57195.1 immunoglobulin heavy chain junction region [Macaca mulatta]